MPTMLSPLSLSELLDRTFSLYRKHFAMFVGITALPYLVWLAVQLAGVVPMSTAATGAVRLGGGLTFWLWWFVAMIVGLLAMAASQAATVVAVSQVYLDRPASIGTAYGSIMRRIPAIMGIMIAVGIGVVFGFVLLIVPGIIWWLMWSLTIPVAVIEKKGLFAAASRSRTLTKENRGRIFVIYVLFVVLMYAVSLLWGIPLGVALGVSALKTRGVPSAGIFGWFQVVNALGTFVTHCLVGPLLTIALSLVYYDQRVRKEAFDLELMMSTLEGQTAGAVAATSSAQ